MHHACQQYIDESNVHYWVDKVKNLSKLRQIEQIIKDTSHDLQQETDASELASKIEGRLTSFFVAEDSTGIDTSSDIASVGYEVVAKQYERYQQATQEKSVVKMLDGVPTGFDMLDRATMGYKPGDLIIVGAQTGHGKTALALHTAVQATKSSNVGYINTEMSKKQIALRVAAMISMVEHDRIRSGNLTPAEYQAIIKAYGELSNRGFYHISDPRLDANRLLRHVRLLKIKHDVELVILDYLGRMDTLDPRLKEYQMLRQITKECKILAQTHEVAVMALVQLNEDNSLQNAKQMKNESDLLLKFLPITEKERYEKQWRNPNVNYKLYIDKNRDGKSGVDIPVCFDKGKQMIYQG